jgi:hypothetical protein
MAAWYNEEDLQLDTRIPICGALGFDRPKERSPMAIWAARYFLR